MSNTPLVPAIEKMDKILNFLFYKEKASQAEISKKLNLSKATTHRLLCSLTELNYLYLENNLYFLGDKIKLLSEKHEKYGAMKKIALSYLEKLSLKYNETLKISVLEEKKIRTILKVESNNLLKISVTNDAVFPPHAGAASKLLLCQLSEKELKHILELPLERYTENTITNLKQLKEELLKINCKKISYDNEEYICGVKAVAVPIYGSGNKIIAAISCPCFPNTFLKNNFENLIKEMKLTSEIISQKLTKII